ncbi:hypothetical protein CONPUDRAFT_56826 [Coniophora puteana RWD-64-598 SS2]|uniref:DUF2470 domain-containing protein n=1 Tax=Coniophora puteana (strain RWD-64-598) TaxID=741705 RepID=A0A5M3MMB3_CONPW|nr:uncharacterized protein CONPUDRAFT_56826 [Coniophora puteana RWD-64-598 SS2]EIW80186.1 hypothetical protein CONPUDRAFT_56826 [Coniophora puteana RWD-64-598 SS2]
MAANDTVASKSAFLCMYMSNHPDTLVAYVKHFGKVPGNVKSAKMTAIDQQAMTLSFEQVDGTGGIARVTFNPPLAGYEEVKPRLLGMKAEAQEALGMIKAPVLTSFSLPLSVSARGIGIVVVMFYFLCPPPAGDQTLFVPAQALHHKSLATFVVFSHIFEALWALYLCRKSVRGFVPTAMYAIATVILGYPVWRDIQRRVQEARIDSVMKVE